MSPSPCLSEAQLLQLMASALATDAVTAVNAHLDGCRACRELAAALAQLESSKPSPPA
jgi:predicted anti-sigma-YlaC factor YlaD